MLKQINLVANDNNWNAEVDLEDSFIKLELFFEILFQVRVVRCICSWLFFLAFLNELAVLVNVGLLVSLDGHLQFLLQLFESSWLHVWKHVEQTVLESLDPLSELVHHFPWGVQVEHDDCYSLLQVRRLQDSFEHFTLLAVLQCPNVYPRQVVL